MSSLTNLRTSVRVRCNRSLETIFIFPLCCVAMDLHVEHFPCLLLPPCLPFVILASFLHTFCHHFLHSHVFPELFLISDARRCTETGFTGSGGRISTFQEGVSFVCRPEAGGSVSPGLQNQHRPRGAAALQGLLLQGIHNMMAPQSQI